MNLSPPVPDTASTRTLVKGLRIKTLLGEFDMDENGVDRATPPGAEGVLAYENMPDQRGDCQSHTVLNSAVKTKMTDYTEFDAALLALIAAGVSSFTSLSGRLDAQAKPFCHTPRAETFRVVDRRLQALRKKNLVAYNAKTGWSLVKAKSSNRG